MPVLLGGGGGNAAAGFGDLGGEAAGMLGQLFECALAFREAHADFFQLLRGQLAPVLCFDQLARTAGVVTRLEVIGDR